MTHPTRQARILKQHMATDQLLGVQVVPINSSSAEHDGGDQDSDMNRKTRMKSLATLDEGEVKPCQKCPLHQDRIQTVFGEGDPQAPLMFIGEGPGQTEDEQGRPFVGRAGELLNKQIAAMGLKRDQVYIANVVKCRPPNNRAPTSVEAHTCSQFLTRQIEIILPKVIVTLGGPAAKLILNTKDGITRIRGQWHDYGGLESVDLKIPVMPTFHPAYLLRSYTTENRKRVWSDLQKVMDQLGLPRSA